MNQPATWSAESFGWEFTSGEPATLQLEGVPPVYFDGGRARTRNWLATKHANGAMHEPNFAFVLAKLFELLDPDVYFDIGGFIGYFSVLPLAWTRRSTRIVTFEMNPIYFRQIYLNIDQNRHLSTSRSIVINAGISDEVAFANPSHVDGFTLGADAQAAASDDRDGFDAVTIDLLTLDYICQTMELRPNLIKMDIEGFEAPALRGANHMLSEVRPTILFELHADSLLEPLGADRGSVLELVESHEYEILELVGDRWTEFDTIPPLRVVNDETRPGILAAGNSALVAVPKERASELAPLVR